MSYRGPFKQFNSDSSDEDTNSDSDSFSKFLLPAIFKSTCSNSNNLNNFKMMQPPVLKQEYLGMIPEFHGETELLPRFIEICQKLVTKFYNKDNAEDFQNEYLMSSILAKIKGKAAINISSCIISNWLDLKTVLLNTYADKRDMYTLNIELANLKQENESAFDFYNRVQQILNLTVSNITTQMIAAEAIILTQYSRNLALRVLLLGLKDPIGSLMRTKNPADLNTALRMLTNDFQLTVSQQKTVQSSKFKFPQKVNPQNKTNFQNRPRMTFPLQLTNYPHNSQAAFKQNNYYSNAPEHFSNNNGRPQSSRNQVDVFRPNQTKSFPKPTPMSISTRNTWKPQNSQFSGQNYRQNQFRNNTQNYIAEELYNIDDAQPSVELPDEHDNNEAENQFFRKEASEHLESQDSN